MTTPLQTQVTPGFGPDGGTAIQLLIEGEPGIFDDADAHLLLFPPVDARLAVSAGTIRAGDSKTVAVQPGVITFSGGSAAQLPKLPIGDNPVFETLYSFDTQGNAVTIGLEFDRATGELRASAECFAVVKYSGYNTMAKRLTYSPLVERIGTGTRVTYGVIAAYFPPGSQITHQVDPANVDLGAIQTEVYRIISYAVSNRDGEFEFPPGYAAGDGTYPDRSFVFDSSNSLQTERVHEIGYVGQNGYAWCAPFHVPIKEPYAGDASYTPTKYFRENSLPRDLDPALIARAKAFIAAKGYGPTGLPRA